MLSETTAPLLGAGQCTSGGRGGREGLPRAGVSAQPEIAGRRLAPQPAHPQQPPPRGAAVLLSTRDIRPPRVPASELQHVARTFLRAESLAECAAQVSLSRQDVAAILGALGRAAFAVQQDLAARARVVRVRCWSVRGFTGRWTSDEPQSARPLVGPWCTHVAVTDLGLVLVDLERETETRSSALWHEVTERWPRARALDGARLRRDGSTAEKMGFEDEAASEWVLEEVLWKHVTAPTLAAGLALRAVLHNCVDGRIDDEGRTTTAPAVALGLVPAGLDEAAVLRALSGGEVLARPATPTPRVRAPSAPPARTAQSGASKPRASSAPLLSPSAASSTPSAQSATQEAGVMGPGGWQRAAAQLRAERTTPLQAHEGYPDDWKRRAVATTVAAMREGVRRKVVARALGIDHGTLGQWLRRLAPGFMANLPALELALLAPGAGATPPSVCTPVGREARETLELPGGLRIGLDALRALRRERLLGAAWRLDGWLARRRRGDLARREDDKNQATRAGGQLVLPWAR